MLVDSWFCCLLSKCTNKGKFFLANKIKDEKNPGCFGPDSFFISHCDLASNNNLFFSGISRQHERKLVAVCRMVTILWGLASPLEGYLIPSVLLVKVTLCGTANRRKSVLLSAGVDSGARIRRESNRPTNTSTFPHPRKQKPKRKRFSYASTLLFPCLLHLRSAFKQRRRLPRRGRGGEGGVVVPILILWELSSHGIMEAKNKDVEASVPKFRK